MYAGKREGFRGGRRENEFERKKKRREMYVCAVQNASTGLVCDQMLLDAIWCTRNKWE